MLYHEDARRLAPHDSRVTRRRKGPDTCLLGGRVVSRAGKAVLAMRDISYARLHILCH